MYTGDYFIDYLIQYRHFDITILLNDTKPTCSLTIQLSQTLPYQGLRSYALQNSDTCPLIYSHSKDEGLNNMSTHG